MKIAFFEVKDWEKDYLRGKLKKHTSKFFSEPLSNKNVSKVRNFEIIAGFIGSKVDKKIIDSLPKLKLITTMSTGFDHIDIKYANKKKIVVTSVPFYGENTVAEHTFGLILSLSRNIHKAYVRTTNKNYSIDGLIGFDLKGKTLGLIGGGHIGMHVAKMAKAFEMKVLVYDLKKDNFLAETIGFKYCSFEKLIKSSDVISLHVPYNEKTHHLIGNNEFNKMKKGVLLINTARGGVIDTKALIKALDSKKVGGVGLDVLEDENFIKEEKEVLHNLNHSKHMNTIMLNKKLLHQDNVVFTPHIAFYSQEALHRILDTTVDNIKGFCNKKVVNQVK
jgi:D-lactate dehydrogenase